MDKYMKLFVFSVIINIIFVSSLGIIVLKKGGVKYLISKFKPKVAEVNAFNVHRQSLFDELSINENNIIFLGDSLIQRCEWAEFFNNNNLKNRGIDGDKTEDVLNRLDCIISGKPKKIFLMVGINDITGNIPLETTVKNYNKIIEKIKINSPNTELFIQSVLPTTVHENNVQVINLNNSIKELAQNSDCSYIDIFSKMSDDKGDLKEGFSKDGTHLMIKGYKTWKETIQDYVN